MAVKPAADRHRDLNRTRIPATFLSSLTFFMRRWPNRNKRRPIKGSVNGKGFEWERRSCWSAWWGRICCFFSHEALRWRITHRLGMKSVWHTQKTGLEAVRCALSLCDLIKRILFISSQETKVFSQIIFSLYLSEGHSFGRTCIMSTSRCVIWEQENTPPLVSFCLLVQIYYFIFHSFCTRRHVKWALARILWQRSYKHPPRVRFSVGDSFDPFHTCHLTSSGLRVPTSVCLQRTGSYKISK